jgi:FkbM family methyltransferase
MTLLEDIKRTPLYRPHSFPTTHNNSLVCYGRNYESFPESLLGHIKAIYCIFHEKNMPGNHERTTADGRRYSIPILPYEELSREIGTDIVFFHPQYEFLPLSGCGIRMLNQGFKSFYVMMPIPHNHEMATMHIPGYYSDNRDALEKTHAMLADDDSRRVFASRVRALETGNVGYVELSEYHEYFHPRTQPVPGDVIIDGGVSESVYSQQRFLDAIGKDGRIFGFEPDPIGFEQAKKKLHGEIERGSYVLVPLGLWSRKGNLSFQINGQGTHVTKEGGASTLSCGVTSIDEFVRENSVSKVDLIKLDVEGAEIEALKGAIATLTRFKPKLAISVYHQPHHLFYIPSLLREIVPEYSFYVGHHQSTLHETILYATAE